ncbi:MFS transporter [Brunnivagina elsteri]|nr:MFS transporter [Calothrix elsteri]
MVTMAVNMLQSDVFKLGLLSPILAQEGLTSLTPEQASVMFSGPKFLVALFAGLIMAIAFQLLFTNFSVAVGISSGADVADDDTDTIGNQIRAVEAKVGIWSIFTMSLALFAACFLAVKLSLIESAFLGAIIGIVIWSAFFALIIWLGSSAVGSLIGSIVNTASSGLKGLMGTASAALGANAAKQQMVSTAEDITAAVRRELTSGFDADSIKNTLQSSLSSVQLPQFNLQDIRSQFDQILKDIDFQSLGDGELLKNVNRQTFLDLISSRTDFSKSDINRIADQLEVAWQQAFNRQNPTEQVINLLKSASPDELKSEKIGERLKELVAVGNGNGKQTNGLIKQTMQSGVGAVAGAVLDKIDLSNVDFDRVTHQLQEIKGKVKDIDVEYITQELKKLRDKATDTVAANIPKAANDNTIKGDVEEYILHSFSWHFNRITLQDEFHEIIFDPNISPKVIRPQLEELNQEYFVNLLNQRQDISEARAKEISEQLESLRREVLELVKNSEGDETYPSLRSRVESLLSSTSKDELNAEEFTEKFRELLQDSETNAEELTSGFGELNRDTLINSLQQRQDLSAEEANNIVNRLEGARDKILNQATELRQKVEEYLRNTNLDELNPEGIERDFKTLIDEPQAGVEALRDRLSQFDRQTLVQLLSQRQDLSEERVNEILDNLESVRDSILQAPQKAATKVKEQYGQTIDSITEYLRSTNLEELNPEGIQRDLQKFLQEPNVGASALGERLSHFDRDTLVTLLTQRGDLNEEQINHIIDSFQQTINNLVKAPQRLAKSASKRVIDFEQNLENYLRNTNKEELNPEGIKRDLQLLLQSPRAGAESLGDRVTKIDRSTLVALLSQREDISEEEANRIVEQIISTRDSIFEQFQQIQKRIQSALDSVFGKIRNYLNSLERPELNYEGIQQDFSKLFDDPQTGFDALRDRLSQFDRNTLVAVISSREDISEEQANQIVNRIESTRDRVLQRAELIQTETQKRLSEVKEKTKKQARDAKKAVAEAAWWLFGTAIASLSASVLAGAIAVRGVWFIG